MTLSPARRLFILILLLLAASFASIKTSRVAAQQAAQPVDELVAKLIDAKSEAERSTLFEASRDLITPELANKLLAQGNTYLNQRQFTQATNAFSAMKETGARLGDKNLMSTAIRAMGAVSFRQSRVEQAIELYKQSLDVCQESCNKNNTVSSLINLGQAYTRQGDYSGALAYLKRAEPMLADLNNKQVSANFFNISGETNKFIGDFSAALAAYQQALALFQADKNEAGITGIQLNIGTVYETVGDYSQAFDYFYKALAAGQARNNKPIMSQALNNLGNVHYRRGDYARALESYEQSLRMKEELKDSFGAANTYGNIANVYYQQGNIAQALAYNQKSLEIKQSLGNQRGVATAYLNLGAIARKQKEYDKALEFYNKALQLSESMGSIDLQAHTLSYLGILYNYKRETAKAFETLSRAATLFKTLNSKTGLMEVLYNQGLTYLSVQKPEQALQIADEAYKAATEAGNLFIQWNVKELAGRAMMNLGKPEQAQKQFAEAIQIAETMRTQAAGNESEVAGFFEELVSPYFGITKSLIAQNKTDEAFYYSERAKGRELLDVLQNGRADVRKAMTGVERSREEKLRIEMASLNTQISQAAQSARPESAKVNDLRTRQQSLRLEYDAFRNTLYAAHPELKVKRADAQIIRAVETASLLDADTALLSYLVVDDTTYLFVIVKAPNKSGIELKSFNIPISRDALADRVSAFRQQLGVRDPEFRQPARQLFELLLKPAQAELQGKTNLIISPDASLWELPFQTLLTSNNRYLIEDAAVAYAPSLTVLRDMMKQRKPRANSPTKTTLLAIGNPSISKETTERAKFSRRDEKLEPLPEAEREVKLLGQIYGSTESRIYTGAEAREDRIKAEVSDFKILHFATHGVLNDATPMYSYLVLAQGGSNEDGLLEAWELMETELRADLVVLSACETARGRVGAGEGVIGLSWALFVAGSPTAVVSQWKVDSAGTSELMLAFHKSLNAGSSVQSRQPSAAGALRAAALSLLKSTEYRHPYYWAGFSVVGAGG